MYGLEFLTKKSGGAARRVGIGLSIVLEVCMIATDTVETADYGAERSFKVDRKLSSASLCSIG